MLTLLTTLIAGAAAHADIRPLLRQQGFEGPLNGRETITYVGHVPEGRTDYRVYVYHGVFLPHPGGVDHGINRLIVVANGSLFVGQYDIPMPTSCKVRGQKVICETQSPGVIGFTRRGPPNRIWFDGEVEHMRHGNRLKR